jgi:hypothetical protein
MGSFDVLDTAPNPPADVEPPPATPAWRALGWGWDVRARRTFERVIVVDSTGAVIGIGVSGLKRLDVPKALRQVSTPISGWTVSMNHGAPGAVVVYGITAAGAACELGRKAWPR